MIQMVQRKQRLHDILCIFITHFIIICFLVGKAIRYTVRAVGCLDPNHVTYKDELNGAIENGLTINGVQDPTETEESTKGALEFSQFPYDNNNSDKWTLDAYDIEALAIGVGILGCGGGAPTYLAKLTAHDCLQRGKKMVIKKHTR